MKEKTIALLLAAGDSTRLSGPLPKPYLALGQETLVRQVAGAFMCHPMIGGVRVVIRREDHGHYKKAMKDVTLFPCVVGGKTRQESVRLGLESLEHRKPERVLIHDVARPFIRPDMISRVLETLQNEQAVVPALPIHDTIKRAENHSVSETIDRTNLFTVQTPQGFHYEALLAAHRQFAHASVTDDAAIMEKAGLRVAMVAGDLDNLKLTTTEDWNRMQHMLAQHSEIRVGIGYDVHALKLHDIDTPVSRQLIKLCGIKIPHTHRLMGHSDADVGLHAMVDALLGAIGAGDIGTHFPPDDRQWLGADSSRFLMHAYELVRAKGGEVVHLDLTLICEKPKIAEHRSAMIHHIAQFLKLPENRISIKATTTEKLGFTGRNEGIAAQAVATVRLPRE